MRIVTQYNPKPIVMLTNDSDHSMIGESSSEQVGKILHAGTNCGSCIPEIKEIIKLNLTS